MRQEGTTVRVAVLGVSGMGLYHVFAMPGMPGYELTGVCDVIEDTCRKVAEGCGAKAYFAVDELVSDETADAAVVATPNMLHASHVRMCLEAGLHVYCEKPLTLTWAEGVDIDTQARAAGRRVQVGFQHRFQHSYAAAKRLVDDGAIGELYRANLYATAWFRPQRYFEDRPWRKQWRTAGGGVLMNQAIHQLDAFAWIAGMPSRVTARVLRRRHDAEVEDDVLALLEFPNGAHGTLVASTVDAAGANRLEFHGELGTLVAEVDALRWGKIPQPVQEWSDTADNAYGPVDISWQDVGADGAPVTFDETVHACYRDFLDAIHSDREPLNTPLEASRAVELANAIYQAGVSGDPVDIPFDPGHYAETFERLSSGAAGIPTR